MSENNQEPIIAPNTQTSSPESRPSTAPAGTPAPVSGDWREQQRAERRARRESRSQRYDLRHRGWIGGAILILVGVVILLRNMGLSLLTNWWALFILIPALGGFVAAWESYQNNGRLTRGGAGSLVGAGLLTILALAFLLNLNLALFFWPVFLIMGGLMLLGTALLSR